MSIKVTKEDNFVWKIVSTNQAISIFNNSIFELFELHGDDSESLIDNKSDLLTAINHGAVFGIEVGELPKKETKKTVSFIEKGDKTLLKEGNNILGYVRDKGKEGFSYSIGKPSDRMVSTFTGEKPLSKAQAKSRLLSAIVNNK